MPSSPLHARPLVLSARDRPPGVPSSIRIDLNKYQFHTIRKEDLVSPLPEDVQKAIHDAAERRLMALGSFYKYLQVPEDGIHEVEAELRKAKHFELLTLTRHNRCAELTALRDVVRSNELRVVEGAHKLVVEGQLLRPVAMRILQEEMEQIQTEERMRLEEDRKSILLRERSVLLDRRRVFEQRNAIDTSASSSSVGGAGASPSGEPAGSHNGPPVLVMNVALGNGNEEKIVVRRNDDPSAVALRFVRKHHLPDHTVSALANQIRTNLTQHLRATSGRAAVTTPTRRTPAGKSPRRALEM